jgi:hypothetical protein
MAHEIVELPMKDDDFPVRYVSLPKGNHSGKEVTTIEPNHTYWYDVAYVAYVITMATFI